MKQAKLFFVKPSSMVSSVSKHPLRRRSQSCLISRIESVQRKGISRIGEAESRRMWHQAWKASLQTRPHQLLLEYEQGENDGFHKGNCVTEEMSSTLQQTPRTNGGKMVVAKQFTISITLRLLFKDRNDNQICDPQRRENILWRGWGAIHMYCYNPNPLITDLSPPPGNIRTVRSSWEPR